MSAPAKTFTYEVSLDRDGAVSSGEGGSPILNEEAWSPEHLVLAGLARCTLTSLDYHASRTGLDACLSGHLPQERLDVHLFLDALAGPEADEGLDPDRHARGAFGVSQRLSGVLFTR